MEIKTTRQIYDAEDFNSSLMGDEAIKKYQEFMDDKWIKVDDLLDYLEGLVEDLSNADIITTDSKAKYDCNNSHVFIVEKIIDEVTKDDVVI